MNGTPIGRRGLLKGGVSGLAGISVLALPDAARASTSVAALAAAPVYDVGDVLLAGWSGGNTSTTTFPLTAQTIASTFANDTGGEATGGTGATSYGGTEYFTWAALTASTRGIMRSDDGRWWWYTKNPDSTLDINAAGVPYLQYSITAGANRVRLSSFFLGAFAGSGKISIRVSTNGYSSALREGSPPSNYSNYVVNLSGVPMIEPRQTLRLRVYSFANPVRH